MSVCEFPSVDLWLVSTQIHFGMRSKNIDHNDISSSRKDDLDDRNDSRVYGSAPDISCFLWLAEVFAELRRSGEDR